MNHNSKMEEKRRNRLLLESVGGHYWGGYFKNDKGWVEHIYPYSANYNRKKWARRHGNRLFRRKEDVLQRNGYKKYYSIMNELF